MQAPTLPGIGSDDESDTQGTSPPMLSGFGSDSDDGDQGAVTPATSSQPGMDQSFMLSQSGAFKLADFQIRPEGGLASIGEAHSPDHAHPAELGNARAAPRLKVNSISDLDMKEELGSGASACPNAVRACPRGLCRRLLGFRSLSLHPHFVDAACRRRQRNCLQGNPSQQRHASRSEGEGSLWNTAPALPRAFLQ